MLNNNFIIDFSLESGTVSSIDNVLETYSKYFLLTITFTKGYSYTLNTVSSTLFYAANAEDLLGILFDF